MAGAAKRGKRPKVKARFLAVIVPFLLLPQSGRAAEIKLLASASLRPAYVELLPQFEKSTGDIVTVAYSAPPISKSESPPAKPRTSSFWAMTEPRNFLSKVSSIPPAAPISRSPGLRSPSTRARLDPISRPPTP